MTDHSTPTAVTVSEESPEIRRWKLFRNNVSMLTRRIRKYQRYALLDDLIQLCEDHGAHANMLRGHEDLGGYAPKSSDSVTVSDRMRNLVDDYGNAEAQAGAGLGSIEDIHRTDDALCREIGWLETVIDQRGKRIQELEAKLASFDAATLTPHPAEDDCEDCAWGRCPEHGPNCSGATCCCVDKHREYASPHSDPASSPPQTRGEAIPAWVTRRVESAREDADFFRRSPDWGLECHACVWLSDDRSRLLTALEEKDQEWNRLAEVAIERLHRNHALQKALEEATKERDDISKLANQYTWELKELRSAAVLQKEELEPLRLLYSRVCDWNNYGPPHMLDEDDPGSIVTADGDWEPMTKEMLEAVDACSRTEYIPTSGA